MAKVEVVTYEGLEATKSLGNGVVGQTATVAVGIFGVIAIILAAIPALIGGAISLASLYFIYSLFQYF